MTCEVDRRIVLSFMHLQAASEKQDQGDFLDLIESRIHLLTIAYEELLNSESLLPRLIWLSVISCAARAKRRPRL